VPECSDRTRVVSPRFVDAAHLAGHGVQVWTVDTEEDARRLLDWGVDAVITDRPDIIVPVVRRRAAGLKNARMQECTKRECANA
jgi:glycerophosphoryl diester phosphodiesterase